jgi:hypothetical protein
MSFGLTILILTFVSALWVHSSREWPTGGSTKTLDLTPMVRRKRP